MFRPVTLGHRQVVSLNRGNHTMYDKICGIRSLLFNESSLLSIKSYYNISLDIEQCEYRKMYLKVNQLVLGKIIAHKFYNKYKFYNIHIVQYPEKCYNKIL